MSQAAAKPNSISAIFNRARRVAFTLRPLKLRQLFFLLLRRGIRPPYQPPRQSGSLNPNFGFHLEDRPDSNQAHQYTGQPFVFLNTPSPFNMQNVQWQPAQMSKLWRYNLHYFDYLHSAQAREAPRIQLPEYLKDFLIQDWINRNTYPMVDAWEPYPASLRIINWIKYFHGRDKTALPHNWLLSLYQQGHFLAHHIEWHIEANHLLKNIIALVIWSHFFNDAYALSLRKRSAAIFKTLCQEQFGADGGHYERSPMYHFILLHHLLEAYNCLIHSNGSAPDWLQHIIKQALLYSRCICKPNGQIPLLKDSAHAIAPSLQELNAQAESLAIRLPNNPAVNGCLYLENAGYFIYQSENDFVLFDVGNISPSYQPGHAHCDALHLEVHWNGRDIFTDTGVFNYIASPERHYARSTRAHNTLMINGAEQHDMWDAFRVAQRGSTREVRAEAFRCSAEFYPFHSRNRHLCHKRSIEINSSGSIDIVDSVVGDGKCSFQVFWHLAPGLLAVATNHPSERTEEITIRDEKSFLVAVIKLQHANVISSITQSEYFREFGKRDKRDCIVFQFNDAQLPAALSYQIIKSC